MTDRLTIRLTQTQRATLEARAKKEGRCLGNFVKFHLGLIVESVKNTIKKGSKK
jgi:uncharacterized protein (DUF1778 family)